ncbi:LCP family protein [Thermogemmatispora sp.]|jgi:LCP family protein required for cell wall assembly|uniref:LCP family protein n=1 Tax=Thermogemmatispora sp. TaxID=1968838 RepID=UPI0035E46481
MTSQEQSDPRVGSDQSSAQVQPPLEEQATQQLEVESATPASALEQQPTLRLQAPRRRRRVGRVLLVALLLVVLLLGGGFAYGYYYFQTAIQEPISHFVHPVSRSSEEPSSAQPASGTDITGHAWNILLLGSDNDGKYTFPAVLTQVMMVVHIDPQQNQVFLVSIPRDSWVFIPQVGGMHKIDQAFFLGAIQHNSFDDGVRLARLTVEKDYGITIDRYAWVGLDGFAKVIDTLGGIDIDLTHPIVDDTYPDDVGSGATDPYGYRRLYLPAGPQHLTGEQALEYVRSRHADLVGDIGRTQRQQQVLEALKKKLDVANVIEHLSSLIADLQGKVYTDISEGEMIGFANYGRTLSSGSIHQVTLGPGPGNQNYGTISTVYDPSTGSNQSVVLPICANIQPLINSIFGLGDAESCHVSGG